MLVEWAVVAAAATAVSAVSPWSSLPFKPKDGARGNDNRPPLSDDRVFHDMLTALSDLQDAYFQRWVGTWPEGIDWTRAVTSTHVAATLRVISDALELSLPDPPGECAVRKAEVISGYFADVIAYYFAEDAFAIRNQAYDDMLWVVLGWLESIQFVDEHGRLASRMASVGLQRTLPGACETWYGSGWTPAFAHRARVFWELAAKGWDTTLCGGGMLWNPGLMPYKNAVTNQLFISASVGMYLHFPGDSNPSPFGFGTPLEPHDPAFLRAARDAHAWLAASNMTNAQGLYADGFHISGRNGSTRCDLRDEMVYTYNQGIILSGLLGLFRATGEPRFLREGHALVENVVRATGWDLERDAPMDALEFDFTTDPGSRVTSGSGSGPRPGFGFRQQTTKTKTKKDQKKTTSTKPPRPPRLPPWRGLGRAGVLEEACDASGTCSQDAQTFKGIWMHHFAAFCAPDALRPRAGPSAATTTTTSSSSSSSATTNTTNTAPAAATATTAATAAAQPAPDFHATACRRYLPWLRHNARAALQTRDARGLFGMWWTAGLLLPQNHGQDHGQDHDHYDHDHDYDGLDGLDDGDAGRGEALALALDLYLEELARERDDDHDDGGGSGSGSGSGGRSSGGGDAGAGAGGQGQKPLGGTGGRHGQVAAGRAAAGNDDNNLGKRGEQEVLGAAAGASDPNLRGRGRTVETQGGGLALLRALWVVSRHEL
ncbi:75533aa5-2bb4-43cd-8013-0b6371e8e8a7 [Thermothielavioides terrestris]|uniref:75533aa5-2bb4-43cd-8013-0b6371e8e8a7 n=1 Tax=Thermothielavioides terrestris TaxID=2587410 RepID=A0A3S4EWK2_9PEZI|nr:75533aa5-2bb4-43cd-8013-0b6371e8e8a7 [Thermothielavioides terrestris]